MNPANLLLVIILSVYALAGRDVYYTLKDSFVHKYGEEPGSRHRAIMTVLACLWPVAVAILIWKWRHYD